MAQTSTAGLQLFNLTLQRCDTYCYNRGETNRGENNRKGTNRGENNRGENNRGENNRGENNRLNNIMCGANFYSHLNLAHNYRSHITSLSEG